MAKTSKGHIQQLPSGSFRVKVYGGRWRPVPDQHATLGQTLGRYLEVADLEVSTREAH
jgi:hypothetical protein